MLSEISLTQKKNHIFFHIHNIDFRKRQGNKKVAIKQYPVGDRKMRETVLNMYKVHFILV